MTERGESERMSDQVITHYIPFFGRDFYASTATWTAEEVGHYIRLLVIQWDSGGLPAEVHRLELVSPGVSRVWGLLEPKFPQCSDGLRRNARMEQHRTKSVALKAKRMKSGKKGGAGSRTQKKSSAPPTPAPAEPAPPTPAPPTPAPVELAPAEPAPAPPEATVERNPDHETTERGSKREANAKQTPKQTGSKTEAKGQAKGVAKTKPPTPTPSPTPEDSPNPHSSSLRSEEFQPPPPPRRPVEKGSTSAFPQPEDGWVSDVPGEWDRLREAWNATSGVERFNGLDFPRTDLLVSRISDPNWLRMYPEALGRLPQCRYFERPVNLSQFLGEHFVANVLCGSYDRPKLGGRAAVTPRKGTL